MFYYSVHIYEPLFSAVSHLFVSEQQMFWTTMSVESAHAYAGRLVDYVVNKLGVFGLPAAYPVKYCCTVDTYHSMVIV